MMMLITELTIVAMTTMVAAMLIVSMMTIVARTTMVAAMMTTVAVT